MEPREVASSWEPLSLYIPPALGLTDLPQQAPKLTEEPIPLEVPALQSPPAITRAADNKAGIELDLLSIESMDIGRYRAMVSQDSTDGQALRGFIKFAHVIPGRQSGNQASLNQILSQIESLCDALNEYTGLRAEFLGSLSYDDPRLLEVPIVAFPQFPLTQTETESLVHYLLGGGFIIYDFRGLPPELEQGLEKYGGLVNGRDFWSEGLPSSNPIFRAFFDFRGSFPGTSYSLNFSGARGLYVKNRLVAIGQLGDWLGKTDDNTRRLMFALNAVVFALTQEGSVTQRIMRKIAAPF